ncbi:MAG: citrate (Si)-synthase, partial [Ignavibacteriaceae bacterium]|nr:citrate (Si)-synthase [Ignavibacteriaceae bacterium]
MLIVAKMEGKIDQWRSELSQLLKEHGEKVVSQVTLSQVYGGMRGVTSLSCDTSEVPKEKGLIIRGIPLADLTEKLPIEIFFLLLTGELPTPDELKDFSMSLKIRKFVPHYVWDVLKSMPKDSHPMTMLSMALLVMQRESHFARRYAQGVSKSEHWRCMLEDALDIVAKLPAIAAAIYRIRFEKGELIQPDPDMNFTQDFVHMMGYEVADNDFYHLMRLFLLAHSDHEGGNVSAFTNLVVNSALSDLYYSLSAGFNGLAGPLHGLANQEAVKWILDLMAHYGGTPSKEQIQDFVNESLASGKVIPGYGHAVLRVVDPRFTAFYNFGLTHCPDDPVFKTVQHIFEVVPEVLKKIEKIQNPWPNVDAVTGSLLYG